MSDDGIKEFDAEEIHDKQISPLMDKIIQICKTNGIPMFATFAFKASDDGEQFCTTCINNPKSHDGRRIPKIDEHFRIARINPGFLAIMPNPGAGPELLAALEGLMDTSTDQTYCIWGLCGQCQECRAKKAIANALKIPDVE